MTGMLGTGTSALLAFQRALGTVSHNVANASTPGYSRQRVELSSRPALPEGGHWVGQGVDAATLQRLADGLVFARQIDSSGELGRLRQLSSLAGRVDGLVSDPATGLAEHWSAFFNAADALAAEPGSTIARSQLLSSAEQLAARWRTLDGQLSALDEEAGKRLQSTVADANRLASEIADLNRAIHQGGDRVAPDLLDARELRISQLAALTGATTVEQDGMLNVFTSGGQPLVVGSQAMQLATTPDPMQPGRMQLSLQTPGGDVRLPSATVSGELGGILEFRERVLDPARAELGRLATAFATAFNQAHRSGVDYAGAPGGDFFSLAPPRVDPHAGNGGNAGISARIDDVAALTGQDLVLRFEGTWSAVRADTGEAVPMSGSGTAADPFRVGGVAFEVTGTPAPGDRFALRPTAGAAASLRVAITDPAAIAAASPLQAARLPHTLWVCTTKPSSRPARCRRPPTRPTWAMRARPPPRSPTRRRSPGSPAPRSSSSMPASTPSTAMARSPGCPAPRSPTPRPAGACRCRARRRPATASPSRPPRRARPTTATRWRWPRSTSANCSRAAPCR